MLQIILLIHIVIALALIGLVLLQQGKGADMGAAFGSGSSNTLFGSRGPASFLMKLTGGLVALFFITSLTLGALATHQVKNQQKLNAPVPAKVLKVNVPAPTKANQHADQSKAPPSNTQKTAHSTNTVPNLGKTTTTQKK